MTKFRHFTWKGFHISGSQGDWHSYAGGQDLQASTIDELKKKIGRVEFAGLEVPSSYRAPRRRRNVMSNPINKSTIGTILIACSVAYFAWCGIIYAKNGTWSWMPWKLSGVAGLLNEGTVIVP